MLLADKAIDAQPKAGLVPPDALPISPRQKPLGEVVALYSTRMAGPHSIEPAPVKGGGKLVTIASNVLYLTLGQAGSTVFGVLLSAALARTLGARDFGLYFLISTTTTFAYSIVEWGQPKYAFREMARHPERMGELLGTGLGLRILIAVVVSIPLLLLAAGLRYGASTVDLLALYFAAMLPLSLAQGYCTAFRALERMERDSLVLIIGNAILFVLVVAALASGGRLLSVGLCQFAAGLAALAVASQLYRRIGASPLAWSRAAARQLWAGGAAIVSVTIVQAVQPYLDVVILSHFVLPDAIGSFGAARTIMGTLVAPALILATASFPQLSRAARGAAPFGTALNSGLRPMVLLGALASAGTYLFAEVAVGTIYGTSHYASAVPILQAFSPLLLLLSVDIFLANALIAADRAKLLLIIKAASVVVSTVLDLLLIPWFEAREGNGAIGVVAAFGLSELIMFGGMVAVLPRGALRFGGLVDAAKTIIAAVLTVFVLKEIPQVSSIVAIPLAVLVFFATACVLGLIHRSDLALVIQMVERRRGVGAPKSG